VTGVHAASSGALIRELVADVLAEFDVWAEHAPSQAAAVAGDAEEAARQALYDVRTEIGDHLNIRLATTLATYGIPPEGRTDP
jgi:hypothetical protein